MIHWPTLLKHDGEDELIYIESAQAWADDEEMLLFIFTERDVLIDSQGQVFSLSDVQANSASCSPLATASVDNLLELVRSHAALQGECCISKIHCQSISECLAIVASLND